MYIESGVCSTYFCKLSVLYNIYAYYKNKKIELEDAVLNTRICIKTNYGRRGWGGVGTDKFSRTSGHRFFFRYGKSLETSPSTTSILFLQISHAHDNFFTVILYLS